MLFASGSPFDPIVDAAGVTHYPAQANNAYIFPAVGYAAVLVQAKEITDEVFVLAAEELSKMTDMDELLVGRSVGRVLCTSAGCRSRHTHTLSSGGFRCYPCLS